MSWAVEEVKVEEMGDLRLGRRLPRMLEKLAKRPEASPAEAFSGRAELTAAYRFWNNPRVSPRKILRGHVEQTVQRALEYPTVLAIQDTTEIDLTDHPATQGTGYLASSRTRGLLMHSVFVVSETGMPLGTIRQIFWTRLLKHLGKRHQRRSRPLKDKESRRWIYGIRAIQRILWEHPHVVCVGDRESDLFPLFAAPRAAHVDLLIRVSREMRRVDHPAKYLIPALEQAPCGGVVQMELPRTGSHRARVAKLSIRWMSLRVHSPKNYPERSSVELQFILVEEIDCPKGVSAIRWILATTMPVESVKDALQYVQWYAYRWRIEQYHQVLKSGCRIEKVQLKNLSAIRRALATYAIVAWHVFWMMLQSRETPNVPCTMILQEHEWKVLHARVRPGVPLPSSPPTLREAVRMIAQLGGFLGRKCDGEPGVKTLWRGWRRVMDLADAWLLAQDHFQPPSAHPDCPPPSAHRPFPDPPS